MDRVGSFVVAVDHASRAGHFPGKPVVPGVVLLDEVLALIGGVVGFPAVRFLRPVRFGEEVVVDLREEAAGGTAFACTVGGVAVLRGTVVLGAAGRRVA